MCVKYYHVLTSSEELKNSLQDYETSYNLEVGIHCPNALVQNRSGCTLE